MRYLMLAALVVTLGGCATTENYEKMLNTWVGAPELDLVRKWGPPTSSYDSSGVRFLTWDRGGQAYVPGTAPSYQTQRIGNTYYTQPVGGSPGYVIHRRCVTTFEVKDGRVNSWRWEGNACKLRDAD
jgi:hypothetical protein